MFRVFREYPKKKVVYIAPLKALVRERMNDWQERLNRRLVIANYMPKEFIEIIFCSA